MRPILPLTVLLSALVVAQAGCSQPRSSSGSAFGDYAITVRWNPRQASGDRSGGSPGANGTINYQSFPGGVAFIVDGELIINGETYGELPKPASIVIDATEETVAQHGGPSVTINGAEAAGKGPDERDFQLSRTQDLIDTTIAEYRVIWQEAGSVYRVEEDSVWTPAGTASVAEGRLRYGDKDYGPLSPGDTIHINRQSVYVNDEKREGK